MTISEQTKGDSEISINELKEMQGLSNEQIKHAFVMYTTQELKNKFTEIIKEFEMENDFDSELNALLTFCGFQIAKTLIKDECFSLNFTLQMLRACILDNLKIRGLDLEARGCSRYHTE